MPKATARLRAVPDGHDLLVAALLQRAADDPGDVLRYINRTLCKLADPSFVTALYAVFDADQRTLRFARAGHPPPMIYRRDENKSVELTGEPFIPWEYTHTITFR